MCAFEAYEAKCWPQNVLLYHPARLFGINKLSHCEESFKQSPKDGHFSSCKSRAMRQFVVPCYLQLFRTLTILCFSHVGLCASWNENMYPDSFIGKTASWLSYLKGIAVTVPRYFVPSCSIALRRSVATLSSLFASILSARFFFLFAYSFIRFHGDVLELYESRFVFCDCFLQCIIGTAKHTSYCIA